MWEGVSEMISVKNRKPIKRIALKTLQTYGKRNGITILAIALTTMLFTALLTVGSTMYKTIQESSFRQAGGSFHGGFKQLTWEQVKELRTDKRIKKSGVRMGVGILTEAPFDKQYTEVSYMDDTYVRYSFCSIEEGTEPEGEWEIACDNRVLDLLGITPEVGARVSLTITLGYGTGSEKEVTGEFILSGWWTFDPASVSANVRVSEKCAGNILAGYSPENSSDFSGNWYLSVFLSSVANCREKLVQILADHGFQNDVREEDNYVGIGVNEGYLTGHIGKEDWSGVAAIVSLLLLILLAGYLIIYNIFQISVSNDIRFYGLLKTIGTTPRQIKVIIHRQAMALSGLGIPAGLLLGWFVGALLAPFLQKLGYTVQINRISTDWRIFFFAAAFSLLTVFLSIRKPGRQAAKASPVEALHYTDVQPVRQKCGGRGSGTPVGMAWANLGRNRKKTTLIVLSLSLAAVLFQMVCIIGNGFDVDKFLQNFVISDFVVGDSYYINRSWSQGNLTEENIADIQNCGYVEKAGVTRNEKWASVSVPEEFYRYFWKGIYGEESLQQQMENARQADGGYDQSIGLYGVDTFGTGKLKVLEGSTDGLSDQTRNAIAAVYQTKDDGEVIPESNYAKIGDKITVRYIDSYGFYAASDGRKLSEEELENVDSGELKMVPEGFHDVTYTVEALVVMPRAMSGRSVSGAEFVLGTDTLLRDGIHTEYLNFMCDVKAGKEESMQEFLADYTQNKAPLLDFESRESCRKSFEGGKNALLLMGSVMSGLLAGVGALNFLNGEITSVLTRKRELATLRAVGMTGRQMKQMIGAEGIFHALLAGLCSFLLGMLANGALCLGAGKLLWFFTFRLNLWPLAMAEAVYLILGVLVPVLVVKYAEKETIVDRLREE